MLSVSFYDFRKMASSPEKQAKECGGSSPLQVGAERKIAVTGLWLTPGQETTQIRFYGHADREQFYTVLFGSAEDGVEPDGYQLWVPFAKGPSFALSIGFHHTNTATETLKTHWLVHAGRGIWRSPNQLTVGVARSAHA